MCCIYQLIFKLLIMTRVKICYLPTFVLKEEEDLKTGTVPVPKM
jgi:hypothetical protein